MYYIYYFIIIEIIILLNYQYFVLKEKIFKTHDRRQIISKIKNLKTFFKKYYSNNIESLLLPNFLDYTANIAAISYLEKNNIKNNRNREYLPYFFNKKLNELKSNLERYLNNKKK